jgi:hypothetical protein
MVYTGDLKFPAARRAGSSPATRTKYDHSLMVEQETHNFLVTGSNPVGHTI